MKTTNSPEASMRLVQVTWAMVAVSVILFVAGVVLYLPVIFGRVPTEAVSLRAQGMLVLSAIAGTAMLAAAGFSYRRGRRREGLAAAAICILYIGLAGWLGGVAAETRRADQQMVVASATVQGRHVVYIGGRIGPTLRWRLEQAIGSHDELTVCLDSYGGDAVAAIDGAEMLLDRKVTAVTDRCWSACAYLLAGADERQWVGPNEVSGAVMVHDVRAVNTTALFGRWTVDRFFKRAGLGERFAEELHQIGTGPVCALSERQMADLGFGGRSITETEHDAICGAIRGKPAGTGGWGVNHCPSSAIQGKGERTWASR